jgi:hypothetical protein
MRALRRLTGIAVVLAAAVTGPPAAAPWVPTPERASARDLTAYVAKRKHPLSGRRRLPAGVRGQLRGAVGVGDAPRCMFDGPAPAPMLTTWSYASFLEVRHGGRVAPAERLFVCAYGFASKRTSPRITARIVRPDGRVAIRHWRSTKPYYWALDSWVVRPGDPTGTYTVTARQGDLTATTSFTAVRPDRPRLFVLDPFESFVPFQVLGKPLTIALAGLPPRSKVWLDFYRTRRLRVRQEFPHFHYFNSVRIRVNRQGMRLYRLETARSDRAAVYQVTLRRRKVVYDGGCFTLTRARGFGACASG